MEWIQEPNEYGNEISPAFCLGDCDLCVLYHCTKSYS